MGYEYLEDVAIADIAFHAESDTLEGLFQVAGDAVTNANIDNLQAIALKEKRAVTLDNVQLDLLLFDFLQEFIYYKDSEQLLLRATQVEIIQKDNTYHLTATLEGEVLDPARHEQRVDVKAVTLHKFELIKTDGGWTATVILDV